MTTEVRDGDMLGIRARLLATIVVAGWLAVGCASPQQSRITVENRTFADVIVAVKHDFGVSTYWVPSCGQVAFDPRAKPDDPDPRASHPGLVIVPIEIHGPPDAATVGTVRITSDGASFSFGAPVTSPPPCSGQPTPPSPSPS